VNLSGMRAHCTSIHDTGILSNKMNERIKELAEQAGIITNLDTDFFEKDPNKWVDYYSEKFAELIVRECIGIVENLSPGYKDYRDQIEDAFRRDCVARMEQHFGVNDSNCQV